METEESSSELDSQQPPPLLMPDADGRELIFTDVAMEIAVNEARYRAAAAGIMTAMRPRLPGESFPKGGRGRVIPLHRNWKCQVCVE